MMLSKTLPPKIASSAREIVAAGNVVTHFQPIFSAKQKSVIGVEALARGIDPRTDELVAPASLFRMAADEGLSAELEHLCRETAVRTFAGMTDHPGELPENLLLFLNFDASAIAQPKDGGVLFLNFDVSADLAETEPHAADALLRHVKSQGLDPRRVAVEILESQFDDVEKLKMQLAMLRQCGFLLVLDDVGAGHANLDRIPLIRPDVIKIDRSLVRHLDTDYHRQETFKSLAQLARKVGALVVAEGVETKMEALLALELGADLLQGFYLARPQSVDLLSGPAAADAVDVLAREYKKYMVQKINERKLQHRRYNILINTLLVELARTEIARVDEVLHEMIEACPNVECLYVLDEAGIQISDTVCQPSVAQQNGSKHNGLIFKPAREGTDHSLKEFYFMLLDVELQKYTTDPYVSLASGNLCRTISTCFRDANNNRMYILCIDVYAGTPVE